MRQFWSVPARQSAKTTLPPASEAHLLAKPLNSVPSPRRSHLCDDVPSHVLTCTGVPATGPSRTSRQPLCTRSVASPGYRLVNNKEYADIEADYNRSFEWFKNAKVDVFLGSHAGFFDLENKSKALKAGATVNPFIDPKGYSAFIDESEKAFRKKLAEQKSASK